MTKCVYFIDTALVIEYISTNKKMCKITTDHVREKGYMFNCDDVNDVNRVTPEEFHKNIQCKLNENTYNEYIYNNDLWTTKSYKKKYEKFVENLVHDIDKIIKIYKETKAKVYE